MHSYYPKKKKKSSYLSMSILNVGANNCTALKINHKILCIKSKKKWEICEVDVDKIEFILPQKKKERRFLLVHVNPQCWSKQLIVRLLRLITK